MLGKEVFLKKTVKSFTLITIFTFFALIAKSEEKNYSVIVSQYINSIDEFSSSFMQIQNNDVNEGMFYLKNKRIRIEYFSPNKIVFVLKKNKAMYYNHELKEVEYFNPSKTAGGVFLDFFYNKDFLKNAKITKEKSYFFIKKQIIIDDEISNVEIYFDENPINLRKVIIDNSFGKTSFAIINPDFNPSLDDKIFSLVNPLL